MRDASVLPIIDICGLYIMAWTSTKHCIEENDSFTSLESFRPFSMGAFDGDAAGRLIPFVLGPCENSSQSFRRALVPLGANLSTLGGFNALGAPRRRFLLLLSGMFNRKRLSGTKIVQAFKPWGILWSRWPNGIF